MFQPLTFKKHHIVHTIVEMNANRLNRFLARTKKDIETDSSLIFIQSILRHCTTFSFHKNEPQDPINRISLLYALTDLKIAFQILARAA